MATTSVACPLSGVASCPRVHDNARMSWTFPPAPRAVLSPCIGVCEVDACGLCRGCHRTLAEIAAWSSLGDAERLHLMDTVLPARDAARGA